MITCGANDQLTVSDVRSDLDCSEASTAPGCTIDTDSLVFSAPGVCTDPADCPMNAGDQCPLAFAPTKDFTTCNQ